MTLTPVTTVFNYTGAYQDFFIPLDCGDRLTWTLNGAGGSSTANGQGGQVQGDFLVTEAMRGQSIRVRVGGRGNAPSGATGGAGGFNGGGIGANATGSGTFAGQGGGGATDIRYLPGGDTLANRALVAGGGGGDGRTGNGGVKGVGGQGGYATGQAGTAGTGVSGQGNAGQGGSQTAGGLGGAGGPNPGGNGSFGQGGNGTNGAGNGQAQGGAGGGGWYGGGAGNAAINPGSGGGGAGGSNWVDFAQVSSPASSGQGVGGAASAHGSASVTYYPVPQKPLILAPTAHDPQAIIRRQLQNLAINPNQEGTLNFTSDSTFPVTSVTKSSTRAFHGTYSTRIQWKQNTLAGHGRANTTLTGLAVGQRYGISFRGSSDNVAGNSRVGFNIRGFAPSAYEKRTFTTILSNTLFEVFEVIFTATATTHVLQVYNVDTIPNTASSIRFTYLDTIMVQPLEDYDEDVSDYFDGDSPGASWDGTPNASSSRQAAILSLDYPIQFNWRYVADALNHSPHWKSKLTWGKYNTGTSSWDGPFAFPQLNNGEVALRIANDGGLLRATLPVSYAAILGDGARYRIYVQDMNQAAVQYGASSYVEFTTPVRPTSPVWADPSFTGTITPPTFVTKTDFPISVNWNLGTSTQQRWRVDAYNWADGTNTAAVALWSSGWIWEAASGVTSRLSFDCLVDFVECS